MRIKIGCDIIKKKNIILSFIFSLLTMFITFYIIFSKHNINTILESLSNVKIIYIIFCFILVLLYFVLQGIYIKLIFKALGTKYSLVKGTFYSMVEFLFSGITPSSSGGQPMVVYHMKKDGIPIKQSTIVMLINTIFFKAFLVLGAIVILIFKPSYVFETNSLIRIFFFLGVGLDVFLTIFYGLLLYNQKLIKVLFTLIYKAYYKLTNKDKSYEEKVNQVLSQYSQEASFIKKHKKEVFLASIITFVQRMFMFSIVYVIYKGLGFSGMSYFEMVLLQIFVQISAEAIFLPGGTGVSEYVSSEMFFAIFGVLSTTGMLLFRLLTFYIPLFSIMVLYVIVMIIRIKKRKKEKETI